MRISLDHVVDRSAEEFFAVVGAPERRPEWNASVRSIEMLTPQPTGVGTRWSERTWGLGTFTIEIVEYEPARRFSEVTLGAPSDLTLTLVLVPIGAHSTLVHLEAGGAMAGWRRIPQRFLEPFMPRLIRADLNRAATR